MSKKRVIISACLLGEFCRYDGKTKKINSVVEAFKEYEIIPFCPEAPLFGTPRERISVMEVDAQERVVTDITKKDVTQLLQEEIETFLKKNSSIDAVVLKSKSPSCGYKTTPVLNHKREILRYGNGVAANIFSKKFKNLTIVDETFF